MNKLEENKKVYNAIDCGLNQKSKDNSEELQTLIKLVHNNGGKVIFIPRWAVVSNSTFLIIAKTKLPAKGNIAGVAGLVMFLELILLI